MPVETKWFFSRFNLIECLGILLISILGSSLVLADQPQVGRKAAQKYFAEDAARASSRESVGENILMIHIGQYTDSEAYQWGPTTPIYGSGQANYGLTYLIDEWHSFDANLRADFSEYSLAGNRAVKLAVEPFITFPRAETKFPLYFGFGAGGGLFMQQLTGASNICLDYELVMGLRFMHLAQALGVFAEFGMKNHLLILSQGQFNGTAIDGGLIFDF